MHVRAIIIIIIIIIIITHGKNSTHEGPTSILLVRWTPIRAGMRRRSLPLPFAPRSSVRRLRWSFGVCGVRAFCSWVTWLPRLPGWWFHIFFIFTRKLGKIPILTNIFKWVGSTTNQVNKKTPLAAMMSFMYLFICWFQVVQPYKSSRFFLPLWYGKAFFFLKIIWLHTSRSMCLFPLPNCQILRDLLPRGNILWLTFLAQKDTNSWFPKGQRSAIPVLAGCSGKKKQLFCNTEKFMWIQLKVFFTTRRSGVPDFFGGNISHVSPRGFFYDSPIDHQANRQAGATAMHQKAYTFQMATQVVEARFQNGHLFS